jgi:hypothetical protein
VATIVPIQAPANLKGLLFGFGVASGFDLILVAASCFGFGLGVACGTSEIGAGRRCVVANSRQQIKQNRVSVRMSP